MNKKPDDIKAIEERINLIKSSEKKADKTKETNSFLYATKTGLRVAVDLLSGVLVGAGLGFVLDRMLNTRPIFLIVMLFLGGAAGFLNVYKFVKAEEDKETSKTQE